MISMHSIVLTLDILLSRNASIRSVVVREVKLMSSDSSLLASLFYSITSLPPLAEKTVLHIYQKLSLLDDVIYS